MSVRLGQNELAFTVDAEQWLPKPVSEIFPFYADARNLEKITPAFLKFEVLTEGEIEMGPGALIDYRLKLRGIPIRWRTEITEWEPPYRFVDRQLKGPYRLWHHTHTFEEKDGGTLIGDHVDYQVPFGALANRLVVARDVEQVFRYRQEALDRLFV